MATYATVADVREALAPEGDTTAATAASLSDSQLTDALVEATSEIDAKVRGAPFAPASVPAVVQAICRDVAAYLATLTQRRNVDLPPTHPIALRYARAESMLTAAAAGKLDLTLDVEAAAGEVSVVNPYDGDLFTLDDAGLGIGTRTLPPWVSGSPWSP